MNWTNGLLGVIAWILVLILVSLGEILGTIDKIQPTRPPANEKETR